MNSEQILELIQTCTYEVIPTLRGKSLGREESLVALGADSMERAEILSLVMEKLSLKIPRIELAGAKTLGDLADLLALKLDHHHDQ
uniref:Acyl carrier protein n=1 Tax=Cyanothece sp. (strain PCC 7425 / ATCC 29141) TaxID=395961 RepID=B8HKZ7_CYAP4